MFITFQHPTTRLEYEDVEVSTSLGERLSAALARLTSRRSNKIPWYASSPAQRHEHQQFTHKAERFSAGWQPRA